MTKKYDKKKLLKDKIPEGELLKKSLPEGELLKDPTPSGDPLWKDKKKINEDEYKEKNLNESC